MQVKTVKTIIIEMNLVNRDSRIETGKSKVASFILAVTISFVALVSITSQAQIPFNGSRSIAVVKEVQ